MYTHTYIYMYIYIYIYMCVCTYNDITTMTCRGAWVKAPRKADSGGLQGKQEPGDQGSRTFNGLGFWGFGV